MRLDLQLGPQRAQQEQEAALGELRQRVRDRMATARANVVRMTSEIGEARRAEANARQENARMRPKSAAHNVRMTWGTSMLARRSLTTMTTTYPVGW